MKRLTTILALAAASFAGTAFAGIDGVKLDGNVSAASDYNFRGVSFTGKNPTFGFGASATHKSGAYASIEENLVNRSDVNGASQHLSAVKLGYETTVGQGIKLGAGASRYQFNGARGAEDNSFSELFVNAGWKGVSATLSRNIDGARDNPAGFAQRDTYLGLGYTHAIGQYTLGGDVGYYWYSNRANRDAKDGVSVAALRATYSIDEHMTLGAAYQADGNDASGRSQERNNTILVNFGYRF